MEKIYHNIKMFMLVTLISAICVELEIAEDFFWIFMSLYFFFCFFTKWKLKKLTYNKEEKHFILITIPLGLLFDFLIKKETIFHIPTVYIGFLMAGLLYVMVMRVAEYIKGEKGNIVE